MCPKTEVGGVPCPVLRCPPCRPCSNPLTVTILTFWSPDLVVVVVTLMLPAALLLLCCWRRYCAAVDATPAGGSARAAEKGAGSAGSEAVSKW